MAVSREYNGLISELDVAQRIRNSVKQHPFRWLGGAVVTGFVTTILRSKSSFKNASKNAPTSTSAPMAAAKAINTITKVGWGAAFFEISKLLYPVLRPIILEFVTNAARTGLARKNRLH